MNILIYYHYLFGCNFAVNLHLFVYISLNICGCKSRIWAVTTCLYCVWFN